MDSTETLAFSPVQVASHGCLFHSHLYPMLITQKQPVSMRDTVKLRHRF